MGILKLLILLIIFSCSKLTYVTKQGYGQLSLELSGRDNQDIYKDKNVDIKIKNKIKKIEKYKEYFYEYFKKEKTAIYSETTFLDRDAVSYLVIGSKFNEIKPLITSFPMAGEFPYLGFYSKDDALAYKKDLESKDYYTFLRPVLAYSTLNRLFFKDNILSTFFKYSDFDLADLIFHELVHTIFFIDDNVSFNESLADYIASEMTNEYFQVSVKENEKKINLKNRYLILSKEITELVKSYKLELEKKQPLSKADADQRLGVFLKNSFMPKLKNKCKSLNINECWPIKDGWNNARFTAFLTYNSKKSIIASIREKNKFTLVKLLEFLELKHEEFKDSKSQNFTDFLSQ